MHIIDVAAFDWVIPEKSGLLMVEKPIAFGNGKMVYILWNCVVLTVFPDGKEQW